MTITWETTPFIKRHHHSGVLVMMYAVSSHHIRHLPEVWDDTFDIMHWAMPIDKDVNQHLPAHNSKATHRLGP